jgi:hypothetical protein
MYFNVNMLQRVFFIGFLAIQKHVVLSSIVRQSSGIDTRSERCRNLHVMKKGIDTACYDVIIVIKLPVFVLLLIFNIL